MEKMPENFKGKIYKKSKYLKTAPREWTEDETNYLIEMNEIGFANKEIAESMDRSEVSVSVKLKRLGKKKNKYEGSHALEKATLNQYFLDKIKPETALFLTGGTKVTEHRQIKNEAIFTNVNSSFGETALKIMCNFFIQECKFDYIDLDTFASCFDAFDLAIKSAKKGLAITLSELGHKRWKRLDFVERYYGIDKMQDFTLDNLIIFIQKIGFRNKKKLTVVYKKEWNNIGRVWFEIENIKVLDVQINDNNNQPNVKKIQTNPEIHRPNLFDFMDGEEIEYSN